MESLAGKLLIAIPELPDGNFYRTVVFVIEHTEDGAMGVILNRPSDVTLEELWDRLDPEIEVNRLGYVHVGGPVNGPVIGIFDHPRFDDTEILDGVFMTMSSDKLNYYVKSLDGKFKSFSGYSGWGPTQLESELESGGWLVLQAKAADIFDNSETLWKSLCERYGNHVLMPVINKPYSGDPNLN
ncbi:MAG: YqgE/AlgH family protein [Planctomycetota bacterium]